MPLIAVVVSPVWFTVAPRPGGAPAPRRPAARTASHARVLHDAAGASPRAGPHHVEITARVAPDAVTRAEARIAPLRQSPAVERQHPDQPTVRLGEVAEVVGV